MTKRKVWNVNPKTGGLFPRKKIIDVAEETFEDKTTDDLSEGFENLYFSKDNLDNTLKTGQDISKTRDSEDNVKIGLSDNLVDGLSTETVQDDAWDVLGGTQSLISVIYDDSNNEVDFSVESDLSKFDNTNSDFISNLTSFTTDDLSEGSNEYFTNSRAVTALENETSTLNLNNIKVQNNSKFSSNLTVQGDLTVNGSEFISNSEVVETSDNTLVLNAGETGVGVTNSKSGLELDRGSVDPFAVFFDEGDDEFKLGKFYHEINYSNITNSPFDLNEKIVGQTSGAEAYVFEDTGSKIKIKRKTGSFNSGETIEGSSNTTADIDSISKISDLMSSLLREQSPTDDGVLYWNASNKVAVTNSNFSFDGTTLTVNDISLVSPASFNYAHSNLSSDKNIGSKEYYSIDTSSGDVTVTLLSTEAISGNHVSIKKNGGNTVIVNTEGSETIDGSNSITIDQDDSAVKLVFNSSTSEWEIF